MNKMQLFFIFWLAGLAACTPIPENVTRVKECAPIYPDYTDITIPYNCLLYTSPSPRDA